MTLHAIIIGEKAKETLHYIDTVRAVQGRGLEGDRYFYKQGTFNKPQLSQDVREIPQNCTSDLNFGPMRIKPNLRLDYAHIKYNNLLI